MSNLKNLASTLEALSLNLTGVAGHVKIHACILSLVEDCSDEKLNELNVLLNDVYSTGTAGRAITLDTMKSLVAQHINNLDETVVGTVQDEIVEDEQLIDPIIIHTQLPLEDEPVVEPVVEPSETDVVFEDVKK